MREIMKLICGNEANSNQFLVEQNYRAPCRQGHLDFYSLP